MLSAIFGGMTRSTSGQESERRDSPESLELPPELWLQIARHLSDEDRCDLLALNSLFFEEGMRLKYETVKVSTQEGLRSMMFLERMRDPFISHKVKTLNLAFVDLQKTPIHATRPTGSVRTMLFNRLPGAIMHTIGRKAAPPTTPSYDDLVEALTTVLPSLSGITSLSIESWNLHPSYDTVPLYQAISANIGATLRSLTVFCNLDGLKLLIENSKPPFPKLETLDIELAHNNFFSVLQHQQDWTLEYISGIAASFVGALAPTLQKLRVWSWAHIDLSTFFSLIADVDFVALEGLNVRTGFTRAIKEPEGLKQFLWNASKTLKEVEFRLNFSGAALDATMEDPLGECLGECLDDERCFAHLKSLDMYPTNTPTGFNALLGVIQRVRPTLQTLVIRDKYLGEGEAKRVISEAAKSEAGLSFFRMNLLCLNLPLLDHIAQQMPGLKRLWLAIGQLESGVPNITDFAEALKQRRYNYWKLDDIAIWQGGQQMNAETMHALAASIPSVTSFFGKGSLVIDDD